MNFHADLKGIPDFNGFKEFLDTIPGIIYEADCEGRITYCNKSAYKITGYSDKDIGDGIVSLDMVAPEDRERVIASAERLLKGESLKGGEYRLRKKDGGYIDVTAHSCAVLEDGVVKGIRGIIFDITERKLAERQYSETIECLAKIREELEQDQENYRLLFDMARDIIYTIGTDLTIRSANKSLYRATGREPSDIIGRRIDEIPGLAIKERKWQDILSDMEKRPEDLEFENTVEMSDGKSHCYAVSLSPILDRDKKLTGILGTNHDITKSKQNEEAIRRLAYHDLLTGLPNRLMLEKRLDEVVSLSSRSGQRFSVLFIDLDNFKKVNDTLGHQTGDLLLIEAGRRLQSGIRKHDIIARIGGDEFVIVLLDIKRARNIGRFAERLIKLFDEPFIIKSHTIYVSPSIGISVYPDDGGSTGELLQNVDTAMYKAKYNGKNNYQFFNSIMKEEITKKVNIEKYLRRALLNEEFSLNYQPLINTKTGKIRGFEALIRWTCPEIGTVPPSEFIPIAEECGLIVPIGEWVLKSACLKKKQWEKQYDSKALISVNISTLHFKQDDFVNKVRSILMQTDLSPEYLELEITESILINCLDDIVKKLVELRKMGIRISLDDFGTGYSSLNYLRILPLDTLKIDKTFIHSINSKSKDNHFVRSIVSLVQKYNLDIVAEGVETPEQLDYLTKCRCDYVQGYLLGRPVAEYDTVGILNDGKVDIKSFTTIA
jgi:diguanylate cyclase (GGDEF)-like protein/PAS domain S-box-containing protein